MRYFSLALIGGLLSASCALFVRPSRFEPYVEGKDGGYYQTVLSDYMATVGFAGNEHTSAAAAEDYAYFRAYEFCLNDGRFRIAVVGFSENRSTTDEVIRSSTYSTGANQVAGSSWVDRRNFPKYTVEVTCLNRIHVLDLQGDSISSADVKPFVKDLLGAAQITSVSEWSKNANILKRGDVVLRLNDQRVISWDDFVRFSNTAPNLDKIKLEVVRDGKRLTVFAVARDYSKEMQVSNLKALSDLCGRRPELAKRPLCEGVKALFDSVSPPEKVDTQI